MSSLPQSAATKSALPARGTPVVYAVGNDGTKGRRHVVEQDRQGELREISEHKRDKILRKGLPYVDAIKEGGDYQEIPLTEKEKYDVIKKSAEVAKMVGGHASLLAGAQPLGADDPLHDTDALPAQRMHITVQLTPRYEFEPDDAPAEPAVATTATTTTTTAPVPKLRPRAGFSNAILSSPLHELHKEVWNAARHLVPVREAYEAFLPEITVKASARQARPLAHYLIDILRAGLTARKLKRISLFGHRNNVLHIECTLFGKLDSESADASEMDADNLGQLESGEKILLTELPSVLDDRLRVHIFLQPCKGARAMWADANETVDYCCQLEEFQQLTDSAVDAALQRFCYKFVCYSLKLA